MNLKIIVLSCLLPLPAAAGALNWNAEPLAQFRAAMAAENIAVALPVAVEAKAAAPAPAPAPSVRIIGKPLSYDLISRDAQAYGDQVYLVLNNDKDRVGAEFQSCYGGGDSPICDQVKFVFPELTVDRAAKVIKHGDEVVATLGGFWKGTRLVKGWRLVVTRTVHSVDSGFDRHDLVRVLVTLEK